MAEVTGRPLRVQLRILLLLSFAGLAIVSVIGAAGLVRVHNDSGALVDRLTPARTASNQLLAAYLDEETGVRGYLLARDDTFLEPYTTGQSTDAAQVTRLTQLLRGRDALEADLAAVATAARTWKYTYADPAVATPDTPPPATTGKAAFDALRGKVDVLNRGLAREVAAAGHRLDHALTLLYILGGAAVVALLGVGLLLRQALRRQVVLPVTGLAERVRVVRDGGFTTPVEATGALEIRSLAADVDAMRQRIVRDYDEVVAARQLLDEQAEELRRSNLELEQFAYVASHDLQEPLRKVASFCQLLEQRYAGQLDERADQYIGFAVDGAKRMQLLINDLLAFSRVGRVGTSREVVELDHCARDALTNLGSLLEETGASVTVDPLPSVAGDRVLLTQVFQNVIGNAVKFRRPDVTPVVRITVQASGDDWELCCSDNGIGIEPQYAERIFTIFQRLHPKEAYAGTGIGLSLCRKIVEHHNGRMWLDTGQADTSAGARVCWTLPQAVTIDEQEQADEQQRV